MCYQGYGHPLMLFLEEGGVVTVCKINTQEPEETLDFDFCSTNVINKIILQSEGLREAFSELDMTSDVLQITVSPDKPYFRYVSAIILNVVWQWIQLYIQHLLELQKFLHLLKFSELSEAFNYFIILQLQDRKFKT